MLDFGIVDTHVHLWDVGRLRYPWLDDIPLLNRPYLPADFRAAHGEIQVDKIVFLQAEVEPAQSLDEAQWVASLAEEEPRLVGMVPWAPLEDGDRAAEALDRLAEIPQVKGVRRIVQFEPDLDFCLRPDFVRGVQLLERYGFSCDICISHEQLANTIELVRRCPNIEFVLDHIGKPDIAAGLMEPWKRELSELARFPNVNCKLSGIVTEADHQAWTPDDLRPYIDHVVESFGFDRLMFGGDWPVVLNASPYVRWVETLHGALAGSSESELRRAFRDNAIDFYRLD